MSIDALIGMIYLRTSYGNGKGHISFYIGTYEGNEY